MAKTTTNIGKVMLTPRGDWNISTTYYWLDVVSYNGSSYISLKEQQGVAPVIEEDHTVHPDWQLSAEKGDKGDKGDHGDPAVEYLVTASISTETEGTESERKIHRLDITEKRSELDPTPTINHHFDEWIYEKFTITAQTSFTLHHEKPNDLTPTVILIDENNEQVMPGDIKYGENTVTITMNPAFTGNVYIK